MKVASGKSDNLIYRILLIMIIVVSVVLHFWNLRGLSLSNDELSSIMRARHSSFLEMIRQGVYTDYHPAGTHIWFFFYNKIFGEDAFVIRLPFVIVSFLSTWILYLIGRRCFGELSGLMAASAFTISSLILQYTQIARMYSPGVFFAILAVYAWMNYIFPNDEHSRRWWWLWVIAMIACLHLHYFCFVFAAGVGLSGLPFLNNKNRWKYILGGIIALLTFVPELPIFREQMKTGDIGGWLTAPDKKFLLYFFHQAFNNSGILIGFVALLAIVGFVFGEKISNQWRWRFLFLFWFAVVFGIAYSYSILVHPVIQFSTILFPLPFIFLFLFSFSFGDRKYLNVGIVVVFLLLGVFTLIKDGFYTKNHFGVFKEVAEDVSAFPPHTPVVVNVVNDDYFEYYRVRIPAMNQQLIYRVIHTKEIANLVTQVDTSSSDYFGFAWTNEFHPWEILQIIRDKYPAMISKKLYFNSAAYLFSKKDSAQTTDLLFEEKNSFEDVNHENEAVSEFFSGRSSQLLNSDMEYSPAIKKPVSELPIPEFGYFTATIWVKSDDIIGDAKLVMSIDADGGPKEYQSADIKEFMAKPGEWNKVVVALEIHEKPASGSVLNVYVWNPKKESFRIDDLTVRLFNADNPYVHY